MPFFIALVSVAILVAIVAVVLHHHWQERYGDNHF